ncbi:J domain-containing protein [Dokdonella soli]|uniref:J domain-containing protein n=1 Tax=Dokdonella soli TaxID=529810 RepID=A0ABN1IN87_9GAMM
MSVDLDFSSLYRELRLTPSASLPDMKLAYRRRVAELHPDRIRDGGDAALAASELQRLTRLYNDAMDFERRYGRLPGAPASAATTKPRIDMQVPRSAAPEPQRRLPWVWLLIGIGLICAILLLVDATVDESDTPAIQSPPSNTTQTVPAATLRLGMPRKIVRDVQGEPYLDGGDRWEYGPSWLLFDRDMLVDWYSSPLNPLKVAHSRPTGSDETDLRIARQRGPAERSAAVE